jgi:hypothetical protein
MANRNFNRYQALEKEIKSLYLQVAIGASGAPTITKGLGVSSISRTSAGLYEVTLADKYKRLMHVAITQFDPDAEDLTFQLTANTVSSDKKFSFVCKAYDGDGAVAATDPSNGSSLFLKIEVKNSGVGE